MPRLTARDMVGLRWSWVGPKLERDEHGNEWYELRIAELPEFFVAAPTAEVARAEAAHALEAFLDSYVRAGEEPPLPAGERASVRLREPA